MNCSLCLNEILDGEESITVDARIRHKVCSEEYEKMVGDLEKIYEDMESEDI